MSSYQNELHRIYVEKINSLYELKELIENIREEYLVDKRALQCMCRASKTMAVNDDQYVYILNNGHKGRYGLEVRYNLYNKVGNCVVKDIKQVRGTVFVNGKKIKIAVDSSGFMRAWMTFKESELRLMTIFYSLLPYRSDRTVTLSEIIDLVDLFIRDYVENWGSLKIAMFEFNKIGGTYTTYYKLLVRFRLYPKLAFKGLGYVQYHRVSGGNHKEGIRYSKVISNENTHKNKTRLTREDIRKARLGRFNKQYSEKSKIIESFYSKHLILRAIATSLQGITQKCQD